MSQFLSYSYTILTLHEPEGGKDDERVYPVLKQVYPIEKLSNFRIANLFKFLAIFRGSFLHDYPEIVIKVSQIVITAFVADLCYLFVSFCQ